MSPPARATVSLQQYVYSSGAIPFQGREKELDGLRGFLKSDSPFAWWLVCGEGGSGKSRLAFALCEECREKGWRAGFVKSRAAGLRDIHREDWTDWRPSAPTLIVLDYAASLVREESREATPDKVDLVHIIHALNNAAHQCGVRVRLLLLEREYRQKSRGDEPACLENQAWYGNLVETFDTQHAAVGNCLHAEPLTLSPMDDHALWSVMQFVAVREKRPLEEGRKADMLQRLRDIDPQARPLFAIFLAAMAANPSADGQPLDRERLIREILYREYANYWKPAGLTPGDLNLLVFATLCGGVSSLPELPASVTRLEAVTADGEALDRFLSLGLASQQGTDVSILPVLPDLVGEYFVLDSRIPVPRGSAITGQLAQAAWKHAPLECAVFFDRCRSDFIGRPELIDLFKRCYSKELHLGVLWSMVALNLVKAYGEAGGLQEARNIFDAMPVGTPEWDLLRARASVNLVGAYGRAGELEGAWELFDTMPEGTPELDLERAQASFNLVKAYGEAGELQKARDLLDAMPGETPELDLLRVQASFNLVTACGNAGALQKARDIFDAMPGGTPELDLLRAQASVNLVKAYGDASQLEEARVIFDSMPVGTPELDLLRAWASFNLVTIYGNEGAFQEARDLLEAMPEGTPELDLERAQASVNLTIAYGDAGALQEARDLLKAMPEGTPELDLERAQASVNLIKAYGDAGALQKARDIFDAMPVGTPELDLLRAQASVNLILAYGGTGQLEDARVLFDAMPAATTELEVVRVAADVLLHLFEDDKEEARRLWKMLPDSEIKENLKSLCE